MLSKSTFIRQSLELHLFFSRIMKEHSFFLEIGFTPKDIEFIETANGFRMEFDKLLAEVVALSNGVVSNQVLKSGEVVTPFTIKAEQISSYYTGVKIPTFITKEELDLVGCCLDINDNRNLEQKVVMINHRALELIKGLINFKIRVLSDVLTCKLFTVNYPLLIDHILREAKLYFRLVEKLQKREIVDIDKDMFEVEAFWNRIMAEHAKFIRGLLDPTEKQLIRTADNFAHEFDKLTMEAIEAIKKTMPHSDVTEESLEATIAIRNFKAQGTVGLIDCKIRSIIIPLLADHTLREANHYLRLLKIFSKEKEPYYNNI